MSGSGRGETGTSGQALVPAAGRGVTIRREGALVAGAAAVGALALGALAVGALALGKLAVGPLVPGRTASRGGRGGEGRIASVTVAELRVVRVWEGRTR